MNSLNHRLDIRLNEEDFACIKHILKHDKGDRFDNISHFVRVAIIRLIREEASNRGI